MRTYRKCMNKNSHIRSNHRRKADFSVSRVKSKKNSVSLVERQRKNKRKKKLYPMKRLVLTLAIKLPKNSINSMS